LAIDSHEMAGALKVREGVFMQRLKFFSSLMLASGLTMSCSGPQKVADPSGPTPVFNALAKYERDDKQRGPLGGDWIKGMELFNSANGAAEARTLIARGKTVILRSEGAPKVLGFSELPIAVEILKNRKVKKLGVPETGEFVTSAEHRKYIASAAKFGEAFNAEMMKHIKKAER
jgi:hypothetical protein